MNQIHIYRYENGVFYITALSALSARNKMRLNILLNSLPSAKIVYETDGIIVQFAQTDTLFVAKNIKKIINYISELQCSVVIDDPFTIEILQKLEEQEVIAKERLKALQDIQNGAPKRQEDFLDFCKACDSNLAIKLRGYQYKAAYLLVKGRGGFDFSVPGAGKTIITYAAYAYMKKQHAVDGILVIGPTSSYNAWHDEFFTCFGRLPEFENLGAATVKLSRAYFTSSKQNHKEITFINIEKIRLLKQAIDAFLSTGEKMLIVDEAHKIKNPEAQATEAALHITKSAKIRVALTGTPMPNGYEDLLTQTKFISPFIDILPYNYMQLKAFSQDVVSDDDVEELRHSIRPYFTRISKKYLLEHKELLPAKFCSTKCDMLPLQRMLYTRLDNFCGKINGTLGEEILAALKKAIIIRKMQISANPALLRKSIMASMDEFNKNVCSGYASFAEDVKLLAEADNMLMASFIDASILTIINSFEKGVYESPKNIEAIRLAKQLIDRGEKVLIWDIFVKNMSDLKRMLETKLKVKVGMINGTVSLAERQEVIASFKDGPCQILLANPATLAESISLHRVCQNAIYVNRNFNAAQFIQSKDRIHRINMPPGTTANYFFVLNRNSVDGVIDARLKLKEERMLKILDADEIEVGGAEFEEAGVMSPADIEECYMR